MRLIKYPSKEQWTELLKRPALNTENLFDTVRSIINKVRAEGDKAVLEYEATFDKVTLSALTVTPEEIQIAGTLVSDELKAAISLAKQNIETFHASQRFIGKKVETMNGVTCWQKSVGIEKVGFIFRVEQRSAFLNCIDVGCSRKNCRMQGNRTLHASR